jgi:hypothetical protein
LVSNKLSLLNVILLQSLYIFRKILHLISRLQRIVSCEPYNFLLRQPFDLNQKRQLVLNQISHNDSSLWFHCFLKLQYLLYLYKNNKTLITLRQQTLLASFSLFFNHFYKFKINIYYTHLAKSNLMKNT